MAETGEQSGDLRKIERALRESEERYRAVLETAVNAIIIMGEDRRIRLVNSAAERMFGYARDEMIGENVTMLMPRPYREKHDSYVERYLETGERKIIGIGREVVAMRKDGGIFPIDLSVGEAELADGKLFTGIIRDLTDRKALEKKLLEVSEEEQRRIGRDLHDDLCQQLAGIGCLVEVLRQKSGNDGGVAENLEEIGRMVGEANARAREIARGLVPAVLESEGLPTALTELAESSSRLFGIACRFAGDDVEMDDPRTKVHLFRIAQEAIANAARHGEARSVEIALGERQGGVVLLVRDDGKGMDGSPDEVHEGMGLLTMEHRAKMLGGQLRIQSEPGQGTTVHCEFPVR